MTADDVLGPCPSPGHGVGAAAAAREVVVSLNFEELIRRIPDGHVLGSRAGPAVLDRHDADHQPEVQIIGEIDQTLPKRRKVLRLTDLFVPLQVHALLGLVGAARP